MGWTLKGDFAGSCVCNTPCPCVFGQDPSHGTCGAVACMSITKGNLDAIDLSGRKVALAFSATGNMFTPGANTIAIYVDDAASDEQVKAIEKILTGKAGGMFEALTPLIKEVKGVKKVPIQFKNGTAPTFQVGTIASVQVEPLPGGDQQNPIVVQNAAFNFGGGVVIGKTTAKFVDKDYGWDWDLTYADSGSLDLAS